MPDELASLKLDVENFLGEFAGQEVLLIPNQGNAGDCLILVGTLDAMRKASVDVEIGDDHADMKDRIVFLGGGGNLVGVYRGMRDSLEAALASKARRIVLLPHTVRSNEDLIGRLDKRVTLWCRERKSFAHVRSVNPDVDCRLAHDMAFHCDVPGLLNDPDCVASGPKILADSLANANVSLEWLAHKPIARFMRTDREATHSKIIGDVDVSHIFGRVADAPSSRLTAWCFLKTIASANHVVTDRLHVSIACALLGKQCELLDNSYSKNRDIHAHSLTGFPRVTFVNALGSSVPDQPPARRSIRARMLRHARRLLQKRHRSA